jgi:hypothetical protein
MADPNTQSGGNANVPGLLASIDANGGGKAFPLYLAGDGVTPLASLAAGSAGTPAAPTAGSTTPVVTAARNGTFQWQVVFAGTATIALEYLLADGTTWFEAGSQTASGVVEIKLYPSQFDTKLRLRNKGANPATNVTSAVLGAGAGPAIPLTISGTPSDVAAGSTFSFTPTTTGGAGQRSYALSMSPDSYLPRSIRFNRSTGALSGTPVAGGRAYGIFITVTDDTGSKTLGPLSFNITGGSVAMSFPATIPSGKAPLAPYTGLVANNLYMPSGFQAATTVIQAETEHTAMEDFGPSNPITVSYANNIMPDEAGPGDVLTVVDSSIIYNGTLVPNLWGGATGTTAANGADTPDSDGNPIVIPKGAKFIHRVKLSNPAGVPYTSFNVNHPTASAEYNAAAATNKCRDINATIGTKGATKAIPFPVSIKGTTTQHSADIHGDSLAYGQGTAAGSPYPASGWEGIVVPALADKIAWRRSALSGDSMATWLTGTNAARRIARGAFASIIFNELGRNDITTAGNTTGAATVLGRINSLKSKFPGKLFIQLTCPPKATSTDDFATVANQTIATDGNNDQRLILNQTLRAGVAGMIILDTSTVLESALDSGLFKAGYTNTASPWQGLHPNNTGYNAVRVSGVIDPEAIKALR